jgi:hypothetical protein
MVSHLEHVQVKDNSRPLHRVDRWGNLQDRRQQGGGPTSTEAKAREEFMA